MGMKGQIMCIEQCTFVISSVSRSSKCTPLDPLAEFKGPTLRTLLLRRDMGRGKERGCRNDLWVPGPETLALHIYMRTVRLQFITDRNFTYTALGVHKSIVTCM